MANIIIGKNIQSGKKLVEFDSAISADENCWMPDCTVDEIMKLLNQGHQLYIPAENSIESRAAAGTFVYFQLECFPFYQKAKEAISGGDEQKGVFRYRRKLNESAHFKRMTDDLFVLSQLFGVIKDLHVKQSKPDVQPVHSIVTVHFEKGCLAHLEYTEAAHSQIEFEWSGIGRILEYNSDEMVSLTPKNESLSLPYENILKYAHVCDEALLNKLHAFETILLGGVQS
jgi:hypothetical protein